MSKSSIKAVIDAAIKQNGTKSITGPVLNSVLNQMVDEVPDVVNDKTTGGTTKAWSAEQGKDLSADVSQLAQEVTDLREDVGEKSIVQLSLCSESDFSVENTALVAQEGVSGYGGTTSASGWSCTQFIDISAYAGKTIHYTKCIVPESASTGTKRIGTVFYTRVSYDTAILGDTVIVRGNENTFEIAEIDIPANAKYVRFSFLNEFLTGNNWVAYIEVVGPYTNGIGKRVEVLDEKTQNLPNIESTTNKMLGSYSPANQTPVPWGTLIQGKYWNLVSGTAGLVKASGYFAKGSLYPVNPGQILRVSVNNSIISDGEATAAFSCYDNDGHPVLSGGTVARMNWSNSDSYINNGDGTTTYTFTIPANCTQIGFYYKTSEITFEIDEPEQIIYSETLDQHIQDVAGGGTTTAGDSAKYYLKGESPKSFVKKICILAAGQSNIDGRVSYADMPEEIKSAQPIANCLYVKNSETGAFAPINIEGQWAFDLVTYYNIALNQDLYVIKWSQGGTSIDPQGDSDYHWTADYEDLDSLSKSLLLKFETEIRNHIASDGSQFDVRAMLWHQGEGDRGALGTGSADRYYNNLRNMLSYIRGIVGNERLPIIIGTISENSAQYDAIIHSAQERLASEDPYFVLIDMSGAPLKDSYHFNAAASVYLGQMAYNSLIDLGVISGTKLTPTRPW